MGQLRVVSPGFLTTIQDGGRFGFAHFGVSASGAADALALRIGNALVGNKVDAAALEMTLMGGEFEFDSSTLVAVSGSDFGTTHNTSQVRPWSSLEVKPGDRLAFGPTKAGARCYLCVSGGFEVHRLLGSSSTHLLTSMGGFNGRSLRKEDLLMFGESPGSPRDATTLISSDEFYGRGPIRVTLGPQSDFFTDNSLEELVRSEYEVKEDSNRMGIRLNGNQLTKKQEGDMLTEGVSLGAVQVPPDGQPIILFVEHQTTGGYPKIANVIFADLHRVGQLRPRDIVRFQIVTFEEAERFLKEQESLLSRLLSDLP